MSLKKKKDNSCQVPLISLPFYSAFSSCYQIEYLAEILKKGNFDPICYHLHYEFGREFITAGHTGFYKKLTSLRYLGDYLVMARMWPKKSAEIISELTQVVPEISHLESHVIIDFYKIFNHVIDQCIEKLTRLNPLAIGLSATHYQLIPSLYFAKRIKEALPACKIILGGYLSSAATAQDILLKNPDIDYIIYGEGEEEFPLLLHKLIGNKDLPASLIKAKRIHQIDVIPKYDTFIDNGPAKDGYVDKVSFSFELSRGCYWNKCDFCNFNAAYGSFKATNFGPVIQEMDRLNEKYGIQKFIFLDTSLPPKLAKHLIKEGLRRNYHIFCEIMSDFSEEYLRAMKAFGIDRVQVGIESFSTAHLKSMIKEASLIDNLHCLRVCMELNIEPIYGILVNKPGDKEEYYKEMINVIKFIQHLPPPKYISEFDLRPDSPIFNLIPAIEDKIVFVQGIYDQLIPAKPYNCELRPSIKKYNELEIDGVLAELYNEVKKWQLNWQSGTSMFNIVERNDNRIVFSTQLNKSKKICISNDEMCVLTYLRTPRTLTEIEHQFVVIKDVKQILEDLRMKQLVYHENGVSISLLPYAEIGINEKVYDA